MNEKAGLSRQKKWEQRERTPAHATKCTLKRQLVFLTARVSNRYCSTSCRHSMDLARAKIMHDAMSLNRGISRQPSRRSFKFQTGKTQTNTNRYVALSMQNTQKTGHLNSEAGWHYFPSKSGNVDNYRCHFNGQIKLCYKQKVICSSSYTLYPIKNVSR